MFENVMLLYKSIHVYKLILKKGNRKTCPLPYLKKKQLPK
nr:MAG TPA: hypothetical protein [Caudoviricetes sp.]